MTMTTPNTEYGTGLLGLLAAAAACATPCQDDGLLQEVCAAPTAPEDPDTTEGTTSASEENTGNDHGLDDGGGGDESASSAAGAGLLPADAGADSTDSGDDGPWCIDADGDGFGDPEQCSNQPEPGRVDNDDDCNDMDDATFPGAAEREPDPQACTTDADGDGWGDAVPADGAIAGADCWDDEPELNPSVVRVGTVDNGPLEDVAATVDQSDATLSVIVPIDTPVLGWSVTAAALRHDSSVLVMEELSARLQRVEYQAVCDGTSSAGEAIAIGPDMSDVSLCGLSFDADDRLWAIDTQSDSVLELDSDTGTPISSVQLTFYGIPLQLGDCDLTWDCHAQRLLLAHATASQVLELDPASGEAELVAEYSPELGTAGIAYEPVERVVFVSSGIHLSRVPLDGTDASDIGTFNYDGTMVADLADLAPLPICD